MSEENVTFRVHVVGVSGSSAEPKPVTAPTEATLQDVLDKLLEDKVVSPAPSGQEWKWKVGNTYQDSGKTLRELGIKNTEPPMGLKLILEQEFA